MTTSRRNVEKFSCTTSRSLLPTFRRPCYREIITINSICDPENEVFSKWSEEDEQYYNIINKALLNDDLKVLKENVRFINSLRMAIKNNNENEFLKFIVDYLLILDIGYIVQNIINDAKINQLRCIDTVQVKLSSKKCIPACVKIFDSTRNMFVYFYKDSTDIYWSRAEKPNEIFLIAQNMNGYWDAPYRYHYRSGYFIDKGTNQWE
ncbi:unnamed protein product [Rotaria sordida]|uniref:Uncharacterized protein n=1 Tax=Rotaria sordida TaxID=392033 RepID=A0A814J7V4_9BILA|nr:unnamed protein product [Rotaria sordida]CAF0972354.1 unnamed protein product [Rotaria sordida]CAF1032339.1 unnamed protein product [Rotaria sordida]CAF4047663.1 unnamed protein product [Rotaria sordida]